MCVCYFRCGSRKRNTRNQVRTSLRSGASKEAVQRANLSDIAAMLDLRVTRDPKLAPNILTKAGSLIVTWLLAVFFAMGPRVSMRVYSFSIALDQIERGFHILLYHGRKVTEAV